MRLFFYIESLVDFVAPVAGRRFCSAPVIFRRLKVARFFRSQHLVESLNVDVEQNRRVARNVLSGQSGCCVGAPVFGGRVVHERHILTVVDDGQENRRIRLAGDQKEPLRVRIHHPGCLGLKSDNTCGLESESIRY